MLGVKSLCLFILTGQLVLFAMALLQGGSSIGSYPGILLIVSAALLSIHSVLHFRLAGVRDWWPRLPETGRMRTRLVVFCAVWVAMVAIMPHIGFILAMTAGVAGSLSALGAGRIWITAPLAGLLSLGLFALVERVLFVPMPRGPIEDAFGAMLYRWAQGGAS